MVERAEDKQNHEIEENEKREEAPQTSGEVHSGNEEDPDDTESASHEDEEEELEDEEEEDEDVENESLDEEGADKELKYVEVSPKERFKRFNEELGSGAYKTVYKGVDQETGREVAWNVIKIQRLPPSERKRITEEVNLIKNLKHPNIIHFISAWLNKEKQELVFITEVVTGGSLKQYLKRVGSPRLKVVKLWCQEILHGLQYLHEQQPNSIIHRDLKCDNIFINSNNGEIRIGDLGLATFMTHSYTSSVLGTPEFMAPELYEEKYDTAVDIWAFGMCVLEMVTQQTPYKECSNPAQIYKKVISGIRPKSLELILDDSLMKFISKCLSKVEDRPSCRDLLEDKDFFGDMESSKQIKIKEVDPKIKKTGNQTTKEKSVKKEETGGFTPTATAEKKISDGSKKSKSGKKKGKIENERKFLAELNKKKSEPPPNKTESAGEEIKEDSTEAESWKNEGKNRTLVGIQGSSMLSPEGESVFDTQGDSADEIDKEEEEGENIQGFNETDEQLEPDPEKSAILSGQQIKPHQPIIFQNEAPLHQTSQTNHEGGIPPHPHTNAKHTLRGNIPRINSSEELHEKLERRYFVNFAEKKDLKNGHGRAIKMTLALESRNAPKKEVYFDFDLGKDTSEGVAEEMVQALNLPSSETQKIARHIQKLVNHYESQLREKGKVGTPVNTNTTEKKHEKQITNNAKVIHSANTPKTDEKKSTMTEHFSKFALSEHSKLIHNFYQLTRTILEMLPDNEIFNIDGDITQEEGKLRCKHFYEIGHTIRRQEKEMEELRRKLKQSEDLKKEEKKNMAAIQYTRQLTSKQSPMVGDHPFGHQGSGPELGAQVNLKKLPHHKLRTSLKRGSKNMYVEDIKMIQYALSTIFPHINMEVDGHFSFSTESVIKLFQETHKMNPDGCVTQAQWEQIYAISEQIKQKEEEIFQVQKLHKKNEETVGQKKKGVTVTGNIQISNIGQQIPPPMRSPQGNMRVPGPYFK